MSRQNAGQPERISLPELSINRFPPPAVPVGRPPACRFDSRALTDQNQYFSRARIVSRLRAPRFCSGGPCSGYARRGPPARRPGASLRSAPARPNPQAQSIAVRVGVDVSPAVPRSPPPPPLRGGEQPRRKDRTRRNATARPAWGVACFPLAGRTSANIAPLCSRVGRVGGRFGARTRNAITGNPPGWATTRV